MESKLGEAFDRLLADYVRHLRSERRLSEHTIRAYAGDVTSMLAYLGELGIVDPGEAELPDLRGWLAQQQSGGAARASVQRRSAAVRVFWANGFGHRRIIGAKPVLDEIEAFLGDRQSEGAEIVSFVELPVRRASL